MIKLSEQLSRYKQFFAEFEPNLGGHKEEITHRTVGYVLGTQLGKVRSPSCVKSIEERLGKLVRSIQAEFGYIHITFDNYCYPDFVLDIAETEVQGYLSSYHSLIVLLLKIFTIAIANESNSNEVYEYVLTYDTNQLSPERQKVLFSEEATLSDINDSDIGELTLKQLDIDLKELF